MADEILPTQSNTTNQWIQFFNQTPAVTPDVNSWRYNQDTLKQTSEQQYPTPVLHPQHKDYSSIETAKRRMEAARIQKIRNRPRPQPQRPVRDMVFYPQMNVPKYNSVLRLSIPKGLR